MKKYVESNGITDILIIFNVFNAYSSTSPGRLVKYLSQPDGSYAAPTVDKTEESTDSSETAAENCVEAVENASPEQQHEPPCFEER